MGTDDDGEDEQGVERSELAALWTDAIGRREWLWGDGDGDVDVEDGYG